jgi:hypothetical protein
LEDAGTAARDMNPLVRTGAWICLAGVAVIVVAGFLPWIQTPEFGPWKPAIGQGPPFTLGDRLGTALNWWWWPAVVTSGTILLLKGRARYPVVAWGTLLVALGVALPALLRQFHPGARGASYASGYWVQTAGYLVVVVGSLFGIKGLHVERSGSLGRRDQSQPETGS